MRVSDAQIRQYCIDNQSAKRDQIAKEMHCHVSRAQKILTELRGDIKTKQVQPKKEPYVSLTQTESGISFDIATKERITTPKQLLQHIGYDSKFWEIERMIANKWEVGAKVKVDENKEKFVVSDLWQVKGFIRPVRGASALKELGDAIIEEIKGVSKRVAKVNYPKYKDACLLEVDLFDAHIGQLVWGLESGENYDLKIAKKTYLDAVASLISRVRPYNIERIVFPIGNDFFNVNGSSSATFMGTVQHEDQRWQKTFKAGCSILFESIDMLSKIAPVDIIVVVGNHDVEPAFYAGEVISAKYFNNPNITVDNGPARRKYYSYGKCLVGFTHGRDEKQSELPLIMANERNDFSKAKFKEWHIGHTHHKKEYKFLSSEEFKGVTVRVLRALTATDAWHNQKGYIGAIRAAEGFVWNKNEGLICNLSVNI